MTSGKADWFLSELKSVVPADRVDADGRPGTWQPVPYRAAGFRGVMLAANPDSQAPEIEITLPLTGRYDLILGMFRNFGDRLLVRLAGERCFERLAYSHPFGEGPCFQDVRWRTLALDGGARLQIRQDGTHRAAFGYILARPVRENLPAEREFMLHVTDDGFPSNWGTPLDHEDASWCVEALSRLGPRFVSRGCDWAGMAMYPSRHAQLNYDCERALKLTSAHGHAPLEILREFQQSGYSVPRRYYEVARQCGLVPLGYSRMAHTRAAPPHNTFFSTLYDQHPEWRCRDIGGDPVSRLSLAFPEVRQAFLSLYTEQVEMGAAGINNVFVRGLPMVLYEAPLRERFRELHGGDMTRLPENDPRAQTVRAEFVTAFMREQRAAMDRAAGGAATIMVTVPATQAVCDFYGLDVSTWIQEGLIDSLCPYRFGFVSEDHRALDLDFFCGLVKNTHVLLLPHVRTWADDVKTLLANAERYAGWPVDGFSLWDGVPRLIDPVWRTAMEGLGSRAGIRDAACEIARGPHHRPVRSVGNDGALLGKYPWGWNT